MAAIRGRSSESGVRAAGVAVRALVLGFTLLAVLAIGPAGPAAASTPPSRAFFALSPISAVAVPGQAATRYRVIATKVPVNDGPAYTWYLHLVGGGAGRACDDSLLPGSTRLSPTEYMWQNQGTSFTWFHGARGTYAAHPAYGCDQTRIGVGGYPGSVTVVAENEYQTCSAGFAGIATVPRNGPAARCALGGYTLAPSTLPVPAALLALYRRLDASLSVLVARERRGTLSASALAAALRPLLAQQQRAFGRLFPPVWGCDFTRLFEGVLGAKAALGAQVAALGSGTRPAASALAADTVDLQGVARAVQACEQSPSHAGGAPRSVVAAAERLSRDAAALRAAAVAGPRGLTLLRARLPGLEGSLDGLVGRDFPTVFGMRFLDLVETTLAEDSAAGLAERTAGTQGAGAAVSALRSAIGSERTIGRGLRTQQKRVVAYENAHA